MAVVFALPPPLESAESALHGGLSPQSWFGRIVPRISPSCLGEGGVIRSFRKSTVPQSMRLLVNACLLRHQRVHCSIAFLFQKENMCIYKYSGQPSIAQTSTSIFSIYMYIYSTCVPILPICAEQMHQIDSQIQAWKSSRWPCDRSRYAFFQCLEQKTMKSKRNYISKKNQITSWCRECRYSLHGSIWMSEREKAAGADDAQLHAHDEPGCEISNTPTTRREKRCRRAPPTLPQSAFICSAAQQSRIAAQGLAAGREFLQTQKRNVKCDQNKSILFTPFTFSAQPT